MEMLIDVDKEENSSLAAVAAVLPATDSLLTVYLKGRVGRWGAHGRGRVCSLPLLSLCSRLCSCLLGAGGFRRV